jgi:hypothetical protein
MPGPLQVLPGCISVSEIIRCGRGGELCQHAHSIPIKQSPRRLWKLAVRTAREGTYERLAALVHIIDRHAVTVKCIRLS